MKRMKTNVKMMLCVAVPCLWFLAYSVVGEEKPEAASAETTPLPVRKALKPVVIDGMLDETCWKSATPVRVEFAYGKQGVKSESLPAMVYYAWDYEYLYVGYETFDASLRAAGTGEEDGPRGNRREAADIGGSNDVFEIFVSFNDPHFFWEIHHNALNNFSDIWVTVAPKDWPLYSSSRAYQGIIWAKEEHLAEGERDQAVLKATVRLKPKKDGKPGTINQGEDIDTGYVGELRLPWKSLGAPREWLNTSQPKMEGQTIVLFAAVQDGDKTPRYHHSSPNQKITGFFHLEAAGWPSYRLVVPEAKVDGKSK